ARTNPRSLYDAAPPPSSEKTLSLPPHEDDGATHVKAVTAQVKAVTTAREGPIPHSLTVCPRAYYLSMSVSTECGLRTEDNSCCSLLKSIVSPSNTALCICILGESDAVKETGMNVQDIINIYAECVGVRPDIPANGCEALESAPPPATSFQYTPPPSASSSHRTILIIILSVSVFGLTLLAVYFLVAKGYGCIGIISWVKARWGADTGSNVELEPVAIVITNSEDEGHEEPQRKSSRNIQRKNYRE
uniref:Uncharacterized protein n=1 Tax=Aegilops tauschii subsp. strangulata TaxID=200361 RepID=A0A453H2F0_AEGTS